MNAGYGLRLIFSSCCDRI